VISRNVAISGSYGGDDAVFSLLIRSFSRPGSCIPAQVRSDRFEHAACAQLRKKTEGGGWENMLTQLIHPVIPLQYRIPLLVCTHDWLDLFAVAETIGGSVREISQVSAPD
jgi:hypothetical protein